MHPSLPGPPPPTPCPRASLPAFLGCLPRPGRAGHGSVTHATFPLCSVVLSSFSGTLSSKFSVHFQPFYCFLSYFHHLSSSCAFFFLILSHSSLPPPQKQRIKETTIEYYSAIKRNEIELLVVRWMDLESVKQSEVSQKEKNKYRMLTHIYMESKKKKRKKQQLTKLVKEQCYQMTDIIQVIGTPPLNKGNGVCDNVTGHVLKMTVVLKGLCLLYLYLRRAQPGACIE